MYFYVKNPYVFMFLCFYVFGNAPISRVLPYTIPLELDTILILAAWPVLVLIYHILVLVGWYFGRYFEH
jgi:hypothetical protein